MVCQFIIVEITSQSSVLGTMSMSKNVTLCYCSEYKEACCYGGMHSLFACITVVRKRCRICRTMKIIRIFFNVIISKFCFESKKFGLVGKFDGFVSKARLLAC